MISKSIRINAIALIVLAGIILSSCTKKDIDFNNMSDQKWTPELAVPLVNTSFTIKDILLETDKQGSISVDPFTGFCTLVYKGNLFSVKGSDLVPLTPLNFNTNYSLTNSDAIAINALSAGASLNLSFSSPINYSTGNANVKIDELGLLTGSLTISVNSDIKQSSVLTISIPNAKKNNIALQTTLNIPASSGGMQNVSTTIDLSGYTFDMTKGGTTFNEFDINYTLALTKTAASSNAGESIQINESFTNQSFSIIKGDVGQQNIVASIDTVPISIFKNAVPGGGDFRINYATIKFDIENSYGVPIRINNIQLFPYGDGQTFPSPIVPLPSAYSSLDINAPTTVGASAFTYPPQIGGPSETTLNSIINAKPKNFIYNVNALSNPNGATTPSNRNFITNTSQFKVDMEINLPLDGGAWDFTFRDTVPFDFGSDSASYINYLLFRVAINNGFPFDVNMNVDFVDSNYVVKETLKPGVPYADVIKSASIDGTGKVTTPTFKNSDFILTKAQLENMKNVKHIILRATGNTSNNGVPNIKIYDYYKMDVRMGIKGEFNISPFKQ